VNHPEVSSADEIASSNLSCASKCTWVFRVAFLLQFGCCLLIGAQSAEVAFRQGVTAFQAGQYENAATAFRQSAARQPASGTLQNLGLAEWQRGKVGPALLAWEQALWLDPFNGAARSNLQFARKAAQVESPELSWNEVVSTWLPVNWWGWLAGLSLWLSVCMGILPGVLRRPRAAWHQAFAAFGAMVFLLSVPAHVGVYTRSRIGFVLGKEIPLRLTPTTESQAMTRLASGEPARRLRSRGHYVLVRTSRAVGWIEEGQLGLICAPGGKI